MLADVKCKKLAWTVNSIDWLIVGNSSHIYGENMFNYIVAYPLIVPPLMQGKGFQGLKYIFPP